VPFVNGVQIIVMVLSGRYNFKQRQLMRQYEPISNTYDGKIIVKFFVGNRPCRVPNILRSTPYTCVGGRRSAEFDEGIDVLEEIISTELKQYDDIVEVDMVDYYRALPKKLKLSYSWSVDNTHAEWFFKIDDDSFYNPHAIVSYFATLSPNKVPVLMGSMVTGSDVQQTGKWTELNYKRNKKYPLFPLGSLSHVVNRPFATFIQNHNDELFEYQGEDVSMGIWADENIVPVPEMMNMSKFFNEKEQCHKSSWACGHEVYEDDFKRFITFID
jgi:hypothetical protein